MSLFVEDNSPWIFFIMTVVIGGGAAFLAGRAMASKWRPWYYAVLYMIPLGLALRFFHYALFNGDLSSLHYFITDTLVLVAAASLGYRDLVLWNVDDRDTQGASASQATAYAERGGRGSIVLMHCGPSITPAILPAVIDYYRARGYRFVTIPTLLGW